MYIISSRANFSNADGLSSSGHIVREIDLTDDSLSRSFSDIDEFLPRISGRKILLLVHGYNNEQEEIYDAYSIIEEKIRVHVNSEYDDIIGYVWPGGDSRLDWWQAKRSANGVARRFRLLVWRLVESALSLDLMSHSLGARVILKAMKQVKVAEGKTLIRNFYCTAASVDDQVFEQEEEFHNSINKFSKICVFHSRRDDVLKFAYGLFERDVALGLLGPEDKAYIENHIDNVFVINCKKKVKKHGNYKHSDDLYAYIFRTLTDRVDRFVTL